MPTFTDSLREDYRPFMAGLVPTTDNEVMYRGPPRYYKVVALPNQNWAVWLADAPMQGSGDETGFYGSENDCWNFVDEMEDNRGFLFHLGAGDVGL